MIKRKFHIIRWGYRLVKLIESWLPFVISLSLVTAGLISGVIPGVVWTQSSFVTGAFWSEIILASIILAIGCCFISNVFLVFICESIGDCFEVAGYCVRCGCKYKSKKDIGGSIRYTCSCGAVWEELYVNPN